MGFESQRRRLLWTLNTRYLYGKVPLLHALVYLIQLAMVSILTRKFSTYYAARPVLTTMITNAILGGVADTTAQTLTAYRRRTAQKHGLPYSDVLIEFEDLDSKRPHDPISLIPDASHAPAPFDFERMTRFVAYPFLMAPVQHKWFSLLSRLFPLIEGAGTSAALKRVAFDQLLFAPVGLALFFTFMTVAEGGGKRAIARKFQDVYIPALKANFMVWPAVQLLNFRVIPLQFQIPFVSTVGIAWTAYLSLTNNAAEEMER